MDLWRQRLFVCKVLHRVLYPRRTKMDSKKKKKKSRVESCACASGFTACYANRLDHVLRALN